jgi:hypothetical protein
MINEDTQAHISQERHEYQCQFCNQWADKDLWGPGRTICPNCNQRQLTPDQQLRECQQCGESAFLMDNHWKAYPQYGTYHKFIPGNYFEWNPFSIKDF